MLGAKGRVHLPSTLTAVPSEEAPAQGLEPGPQTLAQLLQDLLLLLVHLKHEAEPVLNLPSGLDSSSRGSLPEPVGSHTAQGGSWLCAPGVPTRCLWSQGGGGRLRLLVSGTGSQNRPDWVALPRGWVRTAPPGDRAGWRGMGGRRVWGRGQGALAVRASDGRGVEPGGGQHGPAAQEGGESPSASRRLW